METKKSKTGAIIGTAVTALLCGCLSLCLCLFGVMTAFGLSTGQYDVGSVTGSGPLPPWAGFAMLCAALFMIAIPIVVGVMTLRDKKPKEVVATFDEPLPPAS